MVGSVDDAAAPVTCTGIFVHLPSRSIGFHRTHRRALVIESGSAASVNAVLGLGFMLGPVGRSTQ